MKNIVRNANNFVIKCFVKTKFYYKHLATTYISNKEVLLTVTTIFSRNLTLKPHHASSTRNTELAHIIKDQWTGYGFDVKLIRYNVLLSFPEKGKINGASLQDGNGTVVYRTAKQEKVLEPSEESQDALPPFSAYSPSGKVKVITCTSNMRCRSRTA